MSYNSVQTTFLQILNRDDCTTDLAQTFLTQALTQIERDARLPCMERSLQWTAYSDSTMSSIPIPSDFIEPIDMYVQSAVGTCYATPTFTAADTWFPLNHRSYRQSLLVPQAGLPAVYARHTGTYVFAGAIPPGVSVRLDYYGQFTPITDPTTDNEATAAIPDLMIYKALGTYAGSYFQHESAPQWEATYQQLLLSVQLQAADADMKGGPMQIAPTHGDCGGYYWPD